MSRPLSCGVLAMLVATAAPTSGRQPTFRSGVDGIRVDVLVTDGAAPIAGLGPDDFEVRDNGVVQAITVTPRSDMPVRVILAVDTSRSVAGPRLESLRAAGRALLNALTGEDEAGLIAFNRTVTELVPVTRERHRLDAALSTVTAADDTALVDATVSAMLAGEADASRSLIMVFSDGADTASFFRSEVALETARSANVVLYGVWSGRQGRPEFLRDIADVSGGRLIDVSRTGNIVAAFLSIIGEFRQRYLITYTPTDVPAGGWHRLEVRVKGRRANVRARRGYYGGR